MTETLRTRRPPPPFRRLHVVDVMDVSPHLRRIVVGGNQLEGFVVDEPAASVRVLIPPADGPLELPAWTGNQFEIDGRRAPIRTFTPRAHDAGVRRLTLEVVLHERGSASDWARRVAVGDEAAVSGPARGHTIDAGAAGYLLAGDETAIPAISQLIEAMPIATAITALIEISAPDAVIALPDHPLLDVEWLSPLAGHEPGQAFADAIERLELLPDVIWVAGEAAAVQRVRKHLFDQRGRSRQQVSAHGYWKFGRAATE